MLIHMAGLQLGESVCGCRGCALGCLVDYLEGLGGAFAKDGAHGG
jgi:hypothetical protein